MFVAVNDESVTIGCIFVSSRIWSIVRDSKYHNLEHRPTTIKDPPIENNDVNIVSPTQNFTVTSGLIIVIPSASVKNKIAARNMYKPRIIM